MIIHQSPYPDISIPQVSLPTFIFRPLEDGRADERLDAPLLMAVPQDDKVNAKPARPQAANEKGSLSLRQAKERAEMWALGLREEMGWGREGGKSSSSSEGREAGEVDNVLSIVSENQVSRASPCEYLLRPAADPLLRPFYPPLSPSTTTPAQSSALTS